jgi:hypothetical protein
MTAHSQNTTHDGAPKAAPEQSKTNFADWVSETQQKLDKDDRARPWKQTFGDAALDGFDGKDCVPVRSCKDVQHSGLGA